jgi:hypothetical protein
VPVNNFTTGKDINLQLVTPNGNVGLNLITSFSSKQESIEQAVKGIDGITRHVKFPNGWSGRFMIERKDSTLDDFFAADEAAYYAGTNVQNASITETIQELAGNITQYRYTGVLLKFDDAGEYKGDSTVKQTMSFIASRRIKIA